MKRSWLEQHFGWIRTDFLRLIDSLKRVETWITIGFVTAFGLIGAWVLSLSMRSDSMLRAVHPAMAFCREQENASIAIIFFSVLFFVLCALATIGEFFNYLDAKRHKNAIGARRSLMTLAGLGSIALFLGLGVVIFLEARCI